MSHFLHMAFAAITASAVCLPAAPPKHTAQINLFSDAEFEPDEQSITGDGFKLRPESIELNADADASILTGGRFTLIGGMAAADTREQDQPELVDHGDDQIDSALRDEPSIENSPADEAPD